MSRERAIELVRRGKRFLVTCHRRPDGDALGSALGLASILRAAGKEAFCWHPEPVPRSLRFLVTGDEPVRDLPAGTFDAIFVTDTAAEQLLPSPFPAREVTGPLVVVDHHAAHDRFGDVVIREEDACATGEVVLRFMRELGVQEVPREAARPLYASIVADTGGFRYASTTPSTLRVAASLLEAGVDPWDVAWHLFEGWPEEKLLLLREVLGTLERTLDGELALLTVTREIVARTGADDEMVEGLVNYGRRIDGVEVAALLWELEPRDGGPRTKVSFRGRRADVSIVAVALGGGGHRAAAAAELGASLDTVRERVVAEAAKLLRGR